MEKRLYYVLMADVIDSRKLDQQNLMILFLEEQLFTCSSMGKR
jgi:hypothetical protein